MGGIRIAVIGWLFMLLVVSGSAAQTLKTGDSEVTLQIDSSRVSVKFSTSLDLSEIASLLDNLPGSWRIDQTAWTIAEYITIDLPDLLSYDNAIAALRTIDAIEYIEPRYTAPDGSAVLTSERLVLGLADGLSEGDALQLLAGAGLQNAKRLYQGTSIFIASRPGGTGETSFQKAASLATRVDILYAYPDVYAPIAPQAYTLWDNYHAEQFHVKKVIGHFNDSTVWDFPVRGDSVVVAIVDDGLVEHEDLPADRILSGYDFFDHDSDPTPGAWRGHGLFCAGIIGADHSTDPDDTLTQSGGIVGVAPNVRFLPIKIFSDSLMEDDIAGAVDIGRAIDSAWQWGADIINCSFAYKYYFEHLDTAFTRAARDGRGGKGCLIIASSGNKIPGKWPLGSLRIPASLPGSYVVGACDLDDSVLAYSQYDEWEEKVNVLAPSGEYLGAGAAEGVWTTDQMGDLGVNRPIITKDEVEPYNCDFGYGNNRHYFCEYDGTSASTAFVSGIAALLLSYDSTLTRVQAYAILDTSALPLTGTVPDIRRGFGRADGFRALIAIARGDCNADGQLTLSDVTKLVNHLWVTYEPLLPSNLLGDVNCDGAVTMTDITLLYNHLFVTFDPLEIPCFKY